MVGKGRLLVLLGLFVAILGLAFVPDSNAKSNAPSSSLPTEYQQSTGNVTVELHVTPQAVAPGEPINVNVVLTNNDSAVRAPEVTLHLPEAVSFNLAELPTGTFYNAQTNEISWQPVVPGADSSQTLNIKLQANLADIKTPEQTIMAVLRSEGQEQTFTTSFWVGVRPTVNLSFNPPQAAVGQPIQLIGDVSGPGPITQIWSLGDGRIIDVSNPEVVYSTPGTYNVILQASNPLGSATHGGQITIVQQPIARFSLSDPASIVNEIVTFNNQSGGQSPLNYLWDFGDGTTSTEKNPTHGYASPGTYQVHLIIQNDVGTSETIMPVSVGLPPTADVIVDEFADAGKPVYGQAFFDDTTSRVLWDMGDGHTYEGEQITHVYWSAGVYQITVTASNEFGDSVIERSISVNQDGLLFYLPLVANGVGSSQGLEIQSSETLIETLPAGEEPVEAITLEPLDLPPDLSPTEQLLVYLNEARRIHNLQPLTPVPELSNAAQSHTDDMAILSLTGHEGSDGSSPAYRVQVSGYPGGYGGEATAWGMQNAIEPVQFWLSSPAHKAIILNPAATDVGVAFSENYRAPNVWYWTAEFGSLNLPRVEVSPPVGEVVTAAPPPEINLLGPPQNSDFTLTSGTDLIFTWSWSEPLSAEQQFSIYMLANGRTFRLGSVRESQPTNQYQFKVPSANVPVTPGLHYWLVRLEDNRQTLVFNESLTWPIVFREPGNEPSNPQPTAEPGADGDATAAPIPRSRSR